ncbi:MULTISPECIES: hypothetical protein [unclassified Crossiella]|uniref:hypothetical protein n=1 Tax=unclassified Crossiella TaxID=2620835 RepID=UPI001FFF390E|nr:MULTISPECIES: hypothetical protein [unclassified Crossiella]MCK2241746.1 hypothetical protein [Crossiella sp. S99.2]MCK2255382.1 hypothetical protein [Crossiella sp. S99.1]
MSGNWSTGWRRLLVIIPAVVLGGEAVALLTGLVSWRDALLLLVVLEIPHIALVLGSMGYATVLAIRRRRAGEPRWTAFRRSYYQVLPTPLAWAVTRELASLVAVGTLLRRPRPGIGGYSAGRGRVFAVLLVVIVVELVVLHQLIPWPGVRLAHDLVGLYSLVIVVGYWAVPRTHPHRLLPDRLELRAGHDVVVTVPWPGTVVAERETRPGRAAITDDVLVLPNGRGLTNLTLHLPEPATARLGRSGGLVRVIELGVEDPAGFRAAVRV